MLGKYLDLSKLRSQTNVTNACCLKSRTSSHLIQSVRKGAGPYYNIVREALEAFHRYGRTSVIPIHTVRRYGWAM